MTTPAPARRFVCTRCRRVQANDRMCGICGGTLFTPFDVAPRLALVPDLPPARVSSSPKKTPAPTVEAFVELVKTDGSEVVESSDRPSTRQIEARDPPSEPPEAPRARASCVSLASVERERIERLPVRWGRFDDVFGGGTPLEKVVLFGGARGTGKTRLLTAGCASVASSSKRPALICSSENESPKELAAMIPPELDASLVHAVCTTDLDDMMSHACNGLSPAIVVFNSIQSINVPGLKKGTDEHAIYLLTLFVELARVLHATIYAVSMMTAEGKLRGSHLYQQYCNTIAMLDRVDDEDAPNIRGERIRLSIAGKNRGGPVNRCAYFQFDGDGILRPEEEK